MSSNGNGSRLIGRDFNFASNRKTIVVDCPELECSFRLRALSIGQARAMTNDSIKQLALMIVDEDNQLIFTTDEDLENLAEMPASVANLLAEAAAKLNGVSKEAMEEARKNLQASQKADSASG
jgi:hypothetical protein